MNQKYKVQVHDEYVMAGNTAVLKCQVGVEYPYWITLIEAELVVSFDFDKQSAQ